MTSLTLRHCAFLLAVCLLCCLECRAQAEPARVDAGQVCAVHRAISHRKPLSPATCATIAQSLNETDDPRLFAAIAVNESGMNPRAINAVTETTMDFGLLQVRCLLDDHQRCTNGPARGLEARRLLDPAINIRTAAAVLASHGGSLTRYSGSTRERGYGARIAVLMAAWAGELRIPKRATGAKWGRVKGLAKRIVEAIGKERRS